jgi:hypothetical protein
MSQETERINLRPTLILGLGGTGCRIALELRARLDERFGSDSGYERAIKFVYFDTAKENFVAYQPNHPERPPAKMQPDEFVSISDVPLHDLMQSKDTNRAIASILPKILHSTQIDQGAQQVRRLGRIALFYHYSRIKDKLNQAISSLRQLDAIGRVDDGKDQRQFHIVDRKRLRVFVLCSICGGTGSGTFLDIAYLARHLAVEAGIRSARAVDVIGVLLMPEAFPEIVTTGAARIRANAYAALLDLEYYNQAATANQHLYHVEFPGETVEVEGAPFSLCYLVSRSGSEGTLRGMVDLAPVLAEALYTKIATRLGEQLDATLDNIRTYLSTYYRGYRAFYSTIGISQLVYPEVWLRTQFTERLQHYLISHHILRKPENEGDLRGDVDAWYQNLEQQIRNSLKTALPPHERVTQSLANLRQEIGRSDDPVMDLQTNYREAIRVFQRLVVAQVRDNVDNTLTEARRSLIQTLHESINQGLNLNSTDTRGGFQWTLRWLTLLEDKLNDLLLNITRFRTSANIDAMLNQHLSTINEALNLPAFGLWQARYRAKHSCTALSSFINNNLRESIIDESMFAVLAQLLITIDQQREVINRAMAFWQRRLPTVRAEIPAPDLNINVQSVLSRDEINLHIRNQIESLMTEDKLGLLLSELNRHIGGLSSSLEAELHEETLEKLLEFCAAQYQSKGQGVLYHLKRKRPQDAAEILMKLGQQAEPLLVYSEGMLQNNPPRRIKVIGAHTQKEADDTIKPGIGDISDVSTVTTGDETTVTFLVTHHGLPVVALSKFDDYRRHYSRLSEDRNAIFHLNEELERMPYDPGSSQFINWEDVETYFARALAYRWIIYLRDAASPNGHSQSANNVFAFSKSFYERLKRVVDEDLFTIRNQIEDLSIRVTHSTESRDYEEIYLRRQLRDLERYREELDKYISGFREVHAKALLGEETAGYPLFHPVSRVPAATLPAALDALLTAKTVPRLFIRAFEREYLEKRDRVEPKVREFLKERQIIDDNNQRTKDEPKMKFSEKGQQSYLLEQRLCDILMVYQRMKHRIYLNEDEHRIPYGYYTASDGSLMGGW